MPRHKGTHWSWKCAMRRCHGKSDKARYYKDRGIQVDPRWHVYENFLADMGERPDGMTLERVDRNLGYTPSNCIWADKKTQMRNKGDNHIIEYMGERLCLIEWAERTGVWPDTIRLRIKKGWPMHEVMRASGVRHHVTGRKDKQK